MASPIDLFCSVTYLGFMEEQKKDIEFEWRWFFAAWAMLIVMAVPLVVWHFLRAAWAKVMR